VQGIPDPTVIRVLSFEPPEHRCRGIPGDRADQLEAAEVRSRVDSEGAQPALARKIRWTCAAVRAGFSRLSAAANSSVAASVRGVTDRGEGINSANPPAR
jgi:hypothetical protein